MGHERTTRLLKIVSLLVFALFFISGVASEGRATKELNKAAEEMFGTDVVKDCRYCHIKKTPTKRDHESNDRGKWLLKEKKRRGAKSIDVAWLKEYKEGK